MTPEILAALRLHAARESPRECCGLVVKVDGVERYWPCRNVAPPDGHLPPEERKFDIHQIDSAAAEDAGEVLAVCHSHQFSSPLPSPADLTMCEQDKLPWIIINHPLGTVHEFGPTGYRAPMVGRPFSHGVLDCYAIVRDHFADLGIAIPDFQRPDDWWLNGGDLYREHFAEAGFAAVPQDTMREHDVLLMQIRSPVPNHAAVYLGGNVILQHLMHRPSGRAIFGGWYRKCLQIVLRHNSLR